MNISLNEVEATAKKAARGAGLPWGVAEEAGKAARWLCANGLDGCGALAMVLRSGAGTLDVGCRLADGGVAETRMTGVVAPVLLLPFAAWLARDLGQPVTVIVGQAPCVTDGTRVRVPGDLPDTGDVQVSPGGEPGTLRALKTRAQPADDDWAALLELAHKTYAPATEESRIRGAGAGLSDND